MKYSIYILVVTLFLYSCKKETINEGESKVVKMAPTITALKVSPNTVREFDGALTFSISYIDGDGDLGFDDADSTAIVITDLRADLIHNYHMSPLTPKNSAIAVQGVIDVKLEHIILIDPNKESEKAKFSVKMVDRAGNWSNEVLSEEIVVTK